MYTHSQYQYSQYIVSVWNNHCKLHSSTIRVYLMEIISIASNVLHEKKLNLIYTRIQYPNSHYILIVCNNHCVLHSYKSRVYLMQSFCISQTRCERQIHSYQYFVVKCSDSDTQTTRVFVAEWTKPIAMKDSNPSPIRFQDWQTIYTIHFAVDEIFFPWK